MYLDKGQKVAGVYMDGQGFTGEVLSRRFITTRNETVEYWVKLDAPLSVFGWERDTVMIHVDFDGNSTSYTKYGPEKLNPIT